MIAGRRILISGAGPVGLSCALFLQKMGANLTIVDKIEERSRYSKALLMNARSLSLLNEVGATERILRKSIRVDHMKVHYNNQLAFVNDVHKPEVTEDPHNFAVFFPQSRTEYTLEQLLKEKSCQVRMNTPLLDFHQDSEGVTVELANS